MESETLLQGEKEQGQGCSYLDSLKSFARRGFETPGGAGESAPGGRQTVFQRGKGWGLFCFVLDFFEHYIHFARIEGVG